MAEQPDGENPMISIHALREESDRSIAIRSIGTSYFNPRSP